MTAVSGKSVSGKSFDTPDETRAPDKTKVEVVRLGNATIGRMTLQPGWRWSECIKPLAKTESCQVKHVGALLSGTLHVRHDDGTEAEITAGQAYVVEPGHDGWVVGNEPVRALEFESAETFARG